MANGFETQPPVPLDLAAALTAPQAAPVVQQQPLVFAPPATPVAAPVAPAVPQFATTGRGTTTATTQKIATPAISKQLTAIEKAGVASQEATDKAIAAKQLEGQLEGAKAVEELKALDVAAAERAEAQVRTQQKVQEAMAARDTAVADFNNQKDETFWGSKTTGERVGLAIALALGAFGSSMSGGPNQALQVINGIANDHNAAAQRRAAQKLKAVEIGRSGVADAQAAQKQILVGLAAEQVAVRERISKSIDVKMAGAKTQEQVAKLEQLKAGNAAEMSKLLIDQEAQFAATESVSTAEQEARQAPAGAGVTTTNSGKEMTSAQLESQAFFESAQDSVQAIETLETDDPEVTTEASNFLLRRGIFGQAKEVPIVGGVLAIVTDPAESILKGQLSDNAQAYITEVDNLVGAKLRKESGAAISVGEYIQEYKKLFPQAGDSPATIRLKTKKRRQLLKKSRTPTGNTVQPLFFEEL